MNIAADHADALLYFLFGDQYSLSMATITKPSMSCIHAIISWFRRIMHKQTRII